MTGKAQRGLVICLPHRGNMPQPGMPGWDHSRGCQQLGGAWDTWDTMAALL